MIDKNKIRNIAIIAHVDHGKTTLVDELFKQSGLFRENQDVNERLMDSMDLEKERGITITSKNGAFEFKDHWINIIDTPGHADFGGQVERVLKMADGAVLLVDAAEGPMPQTHFVLRKALALTIPIIVVINKLDKPQARPDWVLDQVFDLFVKLDAPDDILDFPVLYASARDGYATPDPEIKSDSMIPLLDGIIEYVGPPKGDETGDFYLQISSMDYSSFLGRLVVGKVMNGQLKINDDITLVAPDGTIRKKCRITKIYRYKGNERVEFNDANCGQIVALAGIDGVSIGDTLTTDETPTPFQALSIDPPTLSMTFLVNDSPFAGKEGDYVTGSHLKDRLDRETLSDVALHIEEIDGMSGYKVSGRGELHLSILIEKMRREGYEFQVTRPEVIIKSLNGQKCEPFEQATIEVSEEYQGKVIELLGNRKGIMEDMQTERGQSRLIYKIPTRGLLGFRNEFLTATKGMGTISSVFKEYAAVSGEIKNRKNGVLIAKEDATSIAYALFNLQDRGRLFIGPGVPLYQGQIVGENARDEDLVVNPAKGKKLTNMRASGSDENVVLTPPVQLSLEQFLSFINDDELVEITPLSIRIRKKIRSESDRKNAHKK